MTDRFGGIPVEKADQLGSTPVEETADRFDGIPLEKTDRFGGTPMMEGSEIQEIGAAPELNELSMKAFRASVAASLISSPEELSQALKAQFPSATFREDEKLGTVINLPSGEFALNKPGLSPQDFAQFITRALAFAPATPQGLGLRALAGAAGGAGAIEAGLQQAEEVVGGEFDTIDPAIAGATGLGGQVVGEAVLSPLARAVGGKASDGMRSLLNQAKDLDVDILTTDVIPPNTFMGKTMQQLGEKLGILGTGGKRAAQQKARIEIVEGLAEETGVTLDAPIEGEIFKSLNKGVANQLNRAATLRNEARAALKEAGNVDVSKTLKSIEAQIDKQKALRADADPAIINRLERLKESIVDADFDLVVDLRSNLGDDIRAAFRGEALPTKATAPLQAVKSSIDDDLLTFAKVNDRGAASKWLASNRIFADGYRKAKDTEIKRLLKKGEGTPEVVASIIKSGSPSELKRMNSLIGDEGRKAAQNSIIRDALTESGFFTTGVNPDRFASAMLKPARQRAVNVFFKGQDKKQIEGITRVLQSTRRAQEAPVSTATGQQLAAPIAAIAAAQFDAGASFGVAGTLAASSRAYESKATRNLLIRLANTPKGSQAERKILNQVMPFFQGIIQGTRQLNDKLSEESQ